MIKFHVSLIFFAVVHALDLVDGFSPPLEAVLVVLICAHLFSNEQNHSHVFFLLKFLFCIFFLTAFPFFKPEVKCVIIGVAYYGFIGYSHSKQEEWHETAHSILLSSVVLYFSFTLYAYSSGLWHMAARLNDLAAFCLRLPDFVNIRGRMMGVGILYTAAVFTWFMTPFTFRSKIRWVFVVITASPIVLILHSLIVKYILSGLAGASTDHGIHSLFTLLIPLDVALLALPLFWLLDIRHFNLEKTNKRCSVWLLAAVISAFAAFGWMLPHESPDQVAHGEILLLDDYPLDWNIPQEGHYGQYTHGMFGMLESYLRNWGHQVKKASLSAEAISKSDCLVILNPMRFFTPEEKQLIWDFVNRGGGLLVVGDHTGHEHIRLPANDLLDPVHIGFNFDSAVPLTKRWIHSLDLRYHPITNQAVSVNELQIMIGASLTVSPPSEPIVVGQAGFSDPGDLDNKKDGYLGNLSYRLGKQIGQHVLVAGSRFGKGKVLVFGDSTTFQNGALPHSAAFVHTVFSWLCSRQSPSPWLGTLALLAVALCTCLLLFNPIRPNAVWLIGMAAGLQLGLWASTGSMNNKADLIGTDPSLKKAVIDLAHMPAVNQEPWHKDSLDGFSMCLMRWNYVPLFMKEPYLDRLSDFALLVLVAPTKPFANNESEILAEWVRNGGHLLVTSGYEDALAIEPVIRRFGMEVESVALGTVQTDDQSQPSTISDAWAIRYPSIHSECGITASGYPVAAKVRWGKGYVTLIGSSEFLLNRALESVDTYNEENIVFLGNLLKSR